MLETINIHKELKGYHETDSGEIVPKAICKKCRWVYIVADCDMPKVTTHCRVTGLKIRPKCHEINIDGNCRYYARRTRKYNSWYMNDADQPISWWKRLWILLTDAGYCGP